MRVCNMGVYVKSRMEKRENLNIKCKDIYITRGDSAYLAIKVTDKSGNSLNLTENDTINCQVRVDEEAEQVLFTAQLIHREDGSVIWWIRPENTRSLEVAEYVYDIQIELANGDVFTFVPLSKFILLPESTRKEGD